MNCEEIRHQLSLYIDEQLDEAERHKIEEHLKSCPDCTAYYNKLVKLQEMADEFEPGGDEAYWAEQKEKIIDKIEKAEAEKITPLTVKKSHATMYRVLAVAAVVALVAIVSIFELKYKEPEKIPFRNKKQPATSMPRMSGKQETVDSMKGEYSAPGQYEDIAPQEEAKPSGQAEGEKIEKSMGSPEPVTTEGKLEIKTDVEAVRPNKAAIPVPEMEPEIAPLSEAPTINIKEKTVEPSTRESVERAAPAPASLPDKTAEETVHPEQSVAISDLGKTIKVTADQDVIDKYVVSNQVNRSKKEAASMAEKGPEQKSQVENEEYLYWRAEVDSIETEYGGLFSIHSDEIKAKGRTEKAASNLTESHLAAPLPVPPPFKVMATAYYNLAKLTPSDDERKMAISRLNRLTEIADSSTVKMTEDYLDSLESESK
jgi:hypothetical protein